MLDAKDIRSYIRTIPDFPVPGIQFRDLTTLFNSAEGFRLAIDRLVDHITPLQPDAVAAIDARGFILGGAVAYKVGLPFCTVRKAGKLPGSTISTKYELEYGEAELELHDDALSASHRVVLIDDLLATGGTAAAAVELIEKLGAEVVTAIFVVELPALGGREKLGGMGIDVHALCEFEGD